MHNYKQLGERYVAQSIANSGTNPNSHSPTPSLFRSLWAEIYVAANIYSNPASKLKRRVGCMTPDVMPALESGTDAGTSRVLQAVPRYIRFGPFQIDQQREEVTQNGSRIKLQGKVYQVLLALLEKPGEVVTREELRQHLWPAEKQVNYDANVNTTVNKLRQTLGDSSDRPLYVETIPRKGYCFVAQSEFSDHPAAPHPPATVSTTTSAGESVPTQPQQQSTGEGKRVDSSFWVTLGMIGLILAGMLLGAGIATLWNMHIAPVNPWP
jgi:DNA-binding winged helix-turn-helix (wHTH) protein